MELAILENVGLSKREANLYLALLDLGSTTIGPLVNRTEIPSSKIYEVLHRLEEKGLANHIIIKRQKHFQAADPQVILAQLEEKAEQFQGHLANLKTRQALAQEKQFAEFYEGKEAIFSLIRSLIRSAKEGSDYFSFALSAQQDYKELPLFYRSIAQSLKEKEMHVNVIFQEKDKRTILNSYPKSHLDFIQAKFTSVQFPQGILIIDNDVILIEWEGEPSAVRIRSDTHAKNHKNFFYDIYEQAADYQQKGIHYVG